MEAKQDEEEEIERAKDDSMDTRALHSVEKPHKCHILS